jgi:type VI secretion system protein ImpK
MGDQGGMTGALNEGAPEVTNRNDPRWRPDDDKTVVVPTPGGRRAAPPPPFQTDSESPSGPPSIPPLPNVSSTYEPPERYEPHGPGPMVTGTGVNPLVAVASPLLTLIATLHKTERLADPMGLRARIVRQMRELGSDTQQTRQTPETLKAASYCLCTAIDEAVLRTPWGANSEWRKLSLLRELHGDAWGGEKFFEIMQGRMQDPGPNIDLLELLYLCIALGFQGKYVMLDDGKAKLERKTEQLYELIRRQRGDIERDLSPHWENEEEARVNLEHPVPIWVVAAVAAALLLTTYLGFRYFLANASSPALDQFADFGTESPKPQIEPPPPRPEPTPVVLLDPSTGERKVITPQGEPEPPLIEPPPPPAVDIAEELSGFLQPEIDEGLVTVDDSATHTTVRISAPEGFSLFASGSDRIAPRFMEVVKRIRAGLALHQPNIGGDIIVVGHTDNVPIRRSLRFQDNYDLSLARAASVAKVLLEEPGITSSIEKAGKGASEPIADNGTREGRAKNRRVEILIEK